MPASSFYAEAEYDEQLYTRSFQSDSFDENQTVDDLMSLEMDSIDPANLRRADTRRTTDLVRLYLQEIGRVRLLGRDEEVSEAQRVQRYMELLEKLKEASEAEVGSIQKYVQLEETRARLTSQLGYRPSLERWAAEAGVELQNLRSILSEGKRQWAEFVNLTMEELDRIVTEGEDAKQHMIKANLRLVVSVAKKYQNRGLELLDLIQEGTLGLERAVEKFDPTKGYRFSTYAYWWIRQGITRTIANDARTIRLPIHIVEKLNKLKKAHRDLRKELNRNPTELELAQALDIPADQLRNLQQVRRKSLSLNHRVGKGEDTELMDLLEDGDTQSPEAQMSETMLRQEIWDVLGDVLTEREKDIISLRYGLASSKPCTLEEVGGLFNLSRERVRQIQSKAMRKLRRPQIAERLKSWLG